MWCPSDPGAGCGATSCCMIRYRTPSIGCRASVALNQSSKVLCSVVRCLGHIVKRHPLTFGPVLGMVLKSVLPLGKSRSVRFSQPRSSLLNCSRRDQGRGDATSPRAQVGQQSVFREWSSLRLGTKTAKFAPLFALLFPPTLWESSVQLVPA